jgi:putative pyruvate formate lyase activating enzyme
MRLPLNKQTLAETELKKRCLAERLPSLYELLDPCRLCPRCCLARRRQGELGECGIADGLVVSSVGLHHGEEFPISGYRGSGTVFLAGCNLHCVLCQNWTISQAREGEPVSVPELAQAMLSLQRAGAHNINWVTPTHVVPMLAEALLLARENGLEIPLVYNSGGYDSLEVLALLDGVVDIYMPDMKYGDAATALTLSGIEDYPRHNQAAIREMYRQVGPLESDDQGIAKRGLLVRHLVLPEDLAGSEEVFTFLDEALPGPVDVNVMAQYHPCYRANDFLALRRGLYPSEFQAALKKARDKKSIRIVD